MLSKFIERFKKKRMLKELNSEARRIIDKAKESPLTREEKDKLQNILGRRIG